MTSQLLCLPIAQGVHLAFSQLGPFKYPSGGDPLLRILEATLSGTALYDRTHSLLCTALDFQYGPGRTWTLTLEALEGASIGSFRNLLGHLRPEWIGGGGGKGNWDFVFGSGDCRSLPDL